MEKFSSKQLKAQRSVIRCFSCVTNQCTAINFSVTGQTPGLSVRDESYWGAMKARGKYQADRYQYDPEAMEFGTACSVALGIDHLEPHTVAERVSECCTARHYVTALRCLCVMIYHLLCISTGLLCCSDSLLCHSQYFDALLVSHVCLSVTNISSHNTNIHCVEQVEAARVW